MESLSALSIPKAAKDFHDVGILVIVDRLTVRVEIDDAPIRHAVASTQNEEFSFFLPGCEQRSRSRREHMTRW